MIVKHCSYDISELNLLINTVPKYVIFIHLLYFPGYLHLFLIYEVKHKEFPSNILKNSLSSL